MVIGYGLMVIEAGVAKPLPATVLKSPQTVGKPF